MSNKKLKLKKLKGGEEIIINDIITSNQCNSDTLKLNSSHYTRDQFKYIWAMSDVHGDITALIKCLTISDLVKFENGKYEWIAPEKTALVITGDLIDRYRENMSRLVEDTSQGSKRQKTCSEQDDEELNIILLLNNLAVQAQYKNSTIFRLIGNHEIMRLIDNDPRYVSPYIDETKRSDLNKTLKTNIIQCNAKVILQIGSWIFTHGGISEQLINMVDNTEFRGKYKGTGNTLFEIAND